MHCPVHSARAGQVKSSHGQPSVAQSPAVQSGPRDWTGRPARCPSGLSAGQTPTPYRYSRHRATPPSHHTAAPPSHSRRSAAARVIRSPMEVVAVAYLAAPPAVAVLVQGWTPHGGGGGVLMIGAVFGSV